MIENIITQIFNGMNREGH